MPDVEPLLVALDVDGTILNYQANLAEADYEANLSEAVAEAIARVAQAGHHIVIATGRDPQATLPVLQRLGIAAGFAACSSGAVTLELGSQHSGGFEVVHLRTTSPLPAMQRMEQLISKNTYALELPTGGYRTVGDFPTEELLGHTEPIQWDELADLQVVRVVVRNMHSGTEEFQAALQGVELPEVDSVMGWSAWADLLPQGVNKAYALERIRQELGVPADRTLAVGDGHNDLEMFDWAHRSVAMGNALPQVQRRADEVTASVDQDGLVPVLQGLLI